MREYLVEGFGRYLQLEFKNVMNEDGKISVPVIVIEISYIIEINYFCHTLLHLILNSLLVK